MSARLIFFLAFHFCWWIRRVSHWRECVSALQWKLGKKRKTVWRRRICRKYVSWNRFQRTQDEIYADIVLRRSRGSPSQWFPETEYLCASAIFVVGTSGIPPKLNYRSVKSYSFTLSKQIINRNSFNVLSSKTLVTMSEKSVSQSVTQTIAFVFL